MTATERDRLQAILHADAPVNWVLTGDSITHGIVHTHGARSYVEHLHELIRGDLARAQDVIINTAISGYRIVQILDGFDRRVASWRPDVVTLMIGTNDCSDAGTSFPVIEPSEFAASVARFVAEVRAIDAIPVLQTPPSVDTANAPERARIGAFADAIRSVAAEDDVLLVDQLARFTELGNGGVPWGLMGDPFHPNAAGHATLALEIAQVFDIRPEGSRVLAALQAQVGAGRLAW